MADHIWFLGAATNAMANTGYSARKPDSMSQEDHMVFTRRLEGRMARGERIEPGEVLTDYHLSNIKGNRNLNRNLKLPLWRSNLTHVHCDMAVVLRRFDLSNTTLVPIRIDLPDEALVAFTRPPAPRQGAAPVGVNEAYLIFGLGNHKPTIDIDRSEPIPATRRFHGALVRQSLSCSGPVHPAVFALPGALDGVDIWTDPAVSRTIFVSDRLAQALQAEPYARHLGLKKVLVARPSAA